MQGVSPASPTNLSEARKVGEAGAYIVSVGFPIESIDKWLSVCGEGQEGGHPLSLQSFSRIKEFIKVIQCFHFK